MGQSSPICVHGSPRTWSRHSQVRVVRLAQVPNQAVLSSDYLSPSVYIRRGLGISQYNFRVNQNKSKEQTDFDGFVLLSPESHSVYRATLKLTLEDFRDSEPLT